MERVEFSGPSSDGLQLYYQGWQPEGEAKAVVCLVHGVGEHCGRYAHVGGTLAQAGYTLLGCDLRGHGRSAGQRGHSPTYDALLDDIGGLLEEASARYPGGPRFLYGHSLGGGLVLNYALRRRPAIAGVIASGPWLRLAFQPPAWKVALGRALDRLRPDFSLATGLDVKALSHDPAVIRDYQADPLVHDRISAHMYLEMTEAGEWALAHAGDFPLPLLLVQGGADRLVSAPASQEFATRANGRCTLKLWDGFYHETHNEPQRAEVLRFMLDWLDAQLAAAPVAGQAALARP